MDHGLSSLIVVPGRHLGLFSSRDEFRVSIQLNIEYLLLSEDSARVLEGIELLGFAISYAGDNRASDHQPPPNDQFPSQDSLYPPK